MQFDRENGDFALGLEGGHTKRRVLHAGGDATGREVVNFLIKKVKDDSKIKVFEYHKLAEILVREHICMGIKCTNLKNFECEILQSDNVILASGGISGIFLRTTNPLVTTGDGVALAYDAGAEIADMEFIQFHPTSLYTGTDKTFLISEAVRGEGAYLVNEKGERFMKNYHELLELAPRDVVSIAINREMKRTGSKNIYLDLGHLDASKIKGRFKTIYNTALEFGVDITSDKVPVAPAAHYTIGGIKTGYMGETNIKGLYACGEVASTGVHGANRLASNSLLECLVFSNRAVEHAINQISTNYKPDFKPGEKIIHAGNEEHYLRIKNMIATVLSEQAGLVRNEADLQKGEKELLAIKDEYLERKNQFYISCLLGLVDISLLVIRSANFRRESRGGHLRSDHPEASDKYLGNFIHHKNQAPYFKPLENIMVHHG